tara:strand:- start:1133 stop:1441 length:309 start_codon:yes stop_codon:yes gene_type:complete
MKTPKAPKPTAQEIAVERRQTAMLDEEISEQESRFKAMARGKLGQKSLLGGAAGSRSQAASKAGGASKGTGTGTGGGGFRIPSFMGGNYGGSYGSTGSTAKK